jgi:hypothetical protein
LTIFGLEIKKLHNYLDGRREKMRSIAMYSPVMIFDLENSGKNSPIILYSMIEMYVCLGNEEEEGEEGEDE